MDQQHGLAVADECDLLLDQIEEKLSHLAAVVMHLDQLFAARRGNDTAGVERAMHNLKVTLSS